MSTIRVGDSPTKTAATGWLRPDGDLGHPRPPVWRRPRVLAAVAVLSLMGAACGDDDETSAPVDTDDRATSTSEEPDEPAAAAVDLSAFCQSSIEGEALFTAGPELDEEGNPTPDGLEEFAAQISPAIDSIEQNAPEEVAAEVETLLRGVRAAVEEGDESIVETPEFFRADAAIDAYVYDNCELDGNQEITAVDYAFEGLPESVEPGQIGIRLDNQGDELHEAAILRINDGVDLSVEELLELPEEEAEAVTEFRGVAFAPPGEQASTVVDLEEGRYVAICFIPVGTTSLEEAGPPGDSDVPPHFTQGMVQEFEVG